MDGLRFKRIVLIAISISEQIMVVLLFNQATNLRMFPFMRKRATGKSMYLASVIHGQSLVLENIRFA